MIKNKYKKPKEKFEITVIHVFTACILAISLFAFVSETNAAEIKTNSKSSFVYSLNACIKDLNKDIPTSKQIPSELIVAQAAIETAWGKSRISDEANNLFGIRTPSHGNFYQSRTNAQAECLCRSVRRNGERI